MEDRLILCRHEDRQDYDQVDSYRSALIEIDESDSFALAEYETVTFDYDEHSNELVVAVDGIDIAQYKTIFFTGWFKSKVLEDVAFSIAYYADFHGVKIFNKEILHNRSRSKLSQYVIGALNGITMTSFRFCMDKEIMKQLLNQSQFSAPFILKSITGNKGNDNYLIQKSKDGVAVVEACDDDEGPWYVQQSFVPNDGDFRILVMSDEVVFVMHRLAHGDSHLNNTSQGGTARQVPVEQIPESVKVECVKLAQLIHRDIAGVDMIRDRKTGGYYLLEINNMPQLATGMMVDQKMRLLVKALKEN